MEWVFLIGIALYWLCAAVVALFSAFSTVVAVLWVVFFILGGFRT